MQLTYTSDGGGRDSSLGVLLIKHLCSCSCLLHIAVCKHLDVQCRIYDASQGKGVPAALPGWFMPQQFNLLILLKKGKCLLRSLAKFDTLFCFETLGVGKAFVTSSLQCLQWEPGKKQFVCWVFFFAWKWKNSLFQKYWAWSEFPPPPPLPCQINMIACFTSYAKEFLIFKGNFEKDMLVQPRRLIF